MPGSSTGSPKDEEKEFANLVAQKWKKKGKK